MEAMSVAPSDSAELDVLRRKMESANRTIAVLMDRIEQRDNTSRKTVGLNVQQLALQEIVRQRTDALQQMNQGLIQAASQRKRIERILRETQRIADIGGWELNVETGEIEITEQIRVLLKLAEGVTLTLPLLCGTFIPAHCERLCAGIDRASKERDGFDLNLHASDPTGHSRVFRVVGHPLLDGANVSRVYGVIKDITKNYYAELHRSQSQRLESIGQLAAGIAHEINTPTQFVGDNVRFLQEQFVNLMTIVSKYAAQLNESGAPLAWSERQAEIAQVLKEFDIEFLRVEIPQAIEQSLEGLSRVTSIVSAMKDFSHPGATHKEPADINRSIASTIEVCRNRWRYVAELETDFAANLPAVPCLIAELNQVVLNLIVNAADAVGEHLGIDGSQRGRIRVSTGVVRVNGADFAEIRVQDNGPGISEASRLRIFEPFFTTKPVGSGTGQGLAISRNVVVDKHGGNLFFETTVGTGTTFVIQLPLVDNATAQLEAA